MRNDARPCVKCQCDARGSDGSCVADDTAALLMGKVRLVNTPMLRSSEYLCKQVLTAYLPVMILFGISPGAWGLHLQSGVHWEILRPV